MLVDEILVGQLWQKDGTPFVIVDVGDDVFSAIDSNGYLIKDESFYYLSEADCIKPNKDLGWIKTLYKIYLKAHVKDNMSKQELVNKVGGAIAFAEATGLTKPTIYRWLKLGLSSQKTKNRIKYILNVLKIEFDEDLI